MSRIPQNYLDDMIQRCDLVELISKRVSLKKMGSNYAGCCPFHDEKTPSFTVSPGKRFYHCFGCGAHGNAIGFLMAYDNIEFLDAVQQLASQLGLPPPETGVGPPGWHQLLPILAAACDYYRQCQQDIAIPYWQSRGLTSATLERYQLGYAPAGWRHLLQHLERSYPRQRLLQTGLFAQKSEQRAYDRFRDRMMFPIRNHQGQVIGFGGRSRDGSQPKYLNSPETACFHKGQNLYGLYEARHNTPSLEHLIVVEGYMDVVSLAEHGFSNSVATLGTSVTKAQMQLALRYVDAITFCFDGDRAGRTAAWRALVQTLPLLHDGRRIRFLFLPDGDDPDSHVRQHGAAHFKTQLEEHAQPLSTFFFDHLDATTLSQTMDDQAKLSETAKPLLETIPSGIFKTKMLAKLAEYVGVAADHLSSHLTTGKPAPSPPPKSATGLTPLRLALILLVQNPSLGQGLALPALQTLQQPGIDLLLMVLEACQEPEITTGHLLERWRDHDNAKILARLASWPLTLDDSFDLEQEFRGSITQVLAAAREEEIQALLAKAQRELLGEAEKIRLQALLREKHLKMPA